MQPDRFSPQTVSRAVTYDAGLRAHFQRVYNTMAAGLGVTGLVAYAVANIPALSQAILGSPLYWIAALAPLAFVFFGFSPRAVRTKSATQLSGLFYLFSAVFGLSMASIFVVYTGTSVARVFFITAGMFAGTSLLAYTTKRDLSSMGSLLFMGVIGLLIAMLVNMVLHSTTLQFVISAVGVLVYTGLIAWDTQNIKETYNGGVDAESNNKMAVMGALSLYINFIMLFQFLMQFMGNRN
jgi:FtsH-binding integral membrane protein